MVDTNSLHASMPFIIFGGICLVMAVLGIINNRRNAALAAELMQYAQANGLQYINSASFSLDDDGGGGLVDGLVNSLFSGSSLFPTSMDSVFLSRFQGFQPFGEGYDIKTRNLMIGTKNAVDWYLFDYYYTTGSGKSRQTHHYSIIAGRVPYSFPQLSLKPENLLTRMGEHLGLHDLKFEVDEFNRRYYVTCNEDKVAYDILCPQVIDFLLKQPTRYWQLFSMYVMVVSPDPLTMEMCYEVTQEIGELVSQLPNYVKQDLGFKPTWTTAFD